PPPSTLLPYTTLFRSPIYQRHPQANMYAICQRTRKKLDAIGDAFGVEKRYDDFYELIKDPEVEAVHINSPIPDHAWQSIAALKRSEEHTSELQSRFDL